MAGTLFIVATPIGNLEDITLRALRILGEVDLIACEDTRHTRHLLDHYDIHKPALSYHDHNEQERAKDLVERLKAGTNIALVTDAGTPLISDPGYRLVSEAVAAAIPVVSVPGPSAIVTALAGAGLPTDSFYFGSFLPTKQGQRRRLLEDVRAITCTLLFYEAPHRLLETLADISEILGERELVVCRELTKMHEEWVRGPASVVTAEFSTRQTIKGEITLLISKAAELVVPSRTAQEAFHFFVGQGLSRMDAIKAVAKERGISKREAYTELEKET